MKSQIVDSVSLCQPSCRMMTCFAYANEEAGEIVAHAYTEPVVCLQAVVRHGGEISHDCLIYDPELGLISVNELVNETSNMVGTVFVTPWPPEEDKDRLKIHLAGLRAKAIEIRGHVTAHSRR